MSELLGVFVLAALLAGATGSWSPCGFSMISTLGPCGHGGGRRTTLAACAAFAPGALVGGAITFGGLAAVGRLLGGGPVALAAGALLALAAAALEARGTPIVPQVRRQVPERWRRVLPLPLAAAGYGVLLGLGFTTFVLTFAVPALAGVALAVGDVRTGIATGLAFGIGRALPVVLLAPLSGRRLGLRALDLMAERPAILRGFRAADALALGLVALVLGGTTAQAAELVGSGLRDPSAGGSALAWEGSGGSVLHAGGVARTLPGEDPAAGPTLVAWRADGHVVVARQDDLQPVLRHPAPEADELGLSDTHVGWRERTEAGDRIVTLALTPGAQPRTWSAVAAPRQLGRPSLDGPRLAFHVTGRRQSLLREIDLDTGATRVLRRARGALLLHPSLHGERLLFVVSSAAGQRLMLGERQASGRDRRLYAIAPTARRDRGHEPRRGRHRAGYPGGRRPPEPARPRPGVVRTLWSTALAADGAYVTRLRHFRDGRVASVLLRVPLAP